MNDIPDAQAEVCRRFGVRPFPTPADLKIGVAFNVRDGVQPLNGLRLRPEGDTSGWYIWAGEEWSDDPDFFSPLCVHHLASWCPAAIPYVLLPPGWRFLIAPGYEDVWFDEPLVQTS
ncbi:MAG: hypothetical protein BGO49_23905 [Planctomycetales bacterium 71-10]|nr:MAG: hypothetical protein BGO49_23905 [Planctomycetales bacterium 71-10]